jgi:nucleolar protein 15
MPSLNKNQSRKKMAPSTETKLSSRKTPQKKVTPKSPAKKNLAVVRASRLPHEFSEKELRAFFGQFGTIFKLRLSRSKRTARSKGYAYIQFEMPEVAKIVADATNNYFIAGKPIIVEHMDPESVWPDLFKGQERVFRDLRVVRSAKLRKGHNSKSHGFTDSDKETRDAARAKKLAEAGVEYEFVRSRVKRDISKSKKSAKEI